MPSALSTALDSYRDAVARRALWEDHGHRGDGHLEAAKAAEATARRTVTSAART